MVVAAQPLAATAASLVLAPHLSPRLLTTAGPVAVMIGVAAEGCSFLTGNGILLVGGALITGVGFGAVFSGTLRVLLPTVGRHARSACYVVGYLAYGLSAIAAGFLSDVVGLRIAATGFAGATVAVAVAAIAATATAHSACTGSSTPSMVPATEIGGPQ